MSEEKTSTKGSSIPLMVTSGIIVLLIALYFISADYASFVDEGYKVFRTGDRKQIIQWIEGFDNLGALVIILGMVLQMFMIVVNVVLLMLIAVLAYGPIWGSLIAISGIVVASSIGFAIGRLLGEAAIVRLIGEKSSRKMENQVEKYGYWAVVLVRLSPWLSNDAISFVAGIVRMNYWKFMGATLLGIIPLTVLIAWLGEDWQRLKSGFIWITALTVLGFVIYLIYKKVYKKKNSGDSSHPGT